MSKIFRIFFRSTFFVYLFVCFSAYQAIGQQISEYAYGLTPEQLVRKIFLSGDIYLNNVQFNNSSAPFDTLTGEQIGFYYHDRVIFPEFPYDSCLFLSTGNIGCSNHPFVGYGCGWPPEGNTTVCPELENIADSLIAYPAVLDFDFSLNSTGFSFEYVFASNEYICYEAKPGDNNNDIFAFFLTDLTTGETQNIAVVPDTELPINIDNTNILTLPQFFHHIPVNNFPVVPPDLYYDFSFYGFLSPFTASATIVPNRLYHAKICIANVPEQEIEDVTHSGVFLKCNIFEADIEMTSAIAYDYAMGLDFFVAGCHEGHIMYMLDSGPLNQDLAIHLSYSGSAFEQLNFNPPLPSQVTIPAHQLPTMLSIVPVVNDNITDTLQLIVQYEYSDHSLTRYGIDTVHILPFLGFVLNENICTGDHIQQLWIDSTFTTPGTYTFQRTTPVYYGCDSVTKLIINVYDSPNIVFNETICHGESYTQNGFYFIQPEQDITYTQSLQTTHGCDSIVTLNLTVAPVFTLDTFVAICPGNVFNELGFNGLTTPGVYTQNLSTTLGCDSTIRLTLEVYPITLYHVGGGGNVCSEEGGNLFLDGSDFGRPYKVYCNGTLIETVLGTGNPMQLGPYHESGTYNVECYVNEFCNDFMLGESVLHVTPTPPARQILTN